MWVVKEGHGAPVCEASTVVKCGEKIRLQHVTTGKNLHSHLFKSPLSGNQEVSGYGDNGFGDTGDNWEVVCSSKAENWNRGEVVQFKHVDTGKWLYTHESYQFNQQNCGHQCPIMGQTEVSCSAKKDSRSLWYTTQGVYFPVDEPAKKGGDFDEDL